MEVGRTGTTNEAQREARRSKDGVAGPPTLIRRAKGHEERRNQGTGAQTRLAVEKDGVEVLGYFKQPRDLHKA